MNSALTINLLYPIRLQTVSFDRMDLNSKAVIFGVQKELHGIAYACTADNACNIHAPWQPCRSAIGGLYGTRVLF